MAKLIETSGYMTEGEERAAKHLQQMLPENWLILANKMVTRPNKSLQEIDLIILGEHRLFVIDEKGFSGRIHGDEVRWYTDSREAFPNPIGKMEAAAKIVGGKLFATIPELQDTPAPERVLALILLSNDRVQFLAQGENHWRVLTLPKAAEELQRLDKKGTYSSLKPHRLRIETTLLGLRERPALPRRINTYEIVEELEGGVHYRTLLAKHDRGELRRLKLYFLDQLSHAEQTEQSDLLYRDYDALRRAVQAGLALPCESPFQWSENHYLVFPHHTTKIPSLGAWINEHSTALPLKEGVALVKAVLHALNRLHQLGILHRNLHPGSIYVEHKPSGEWQVLFSDFDFARLPESQSIALHADLMLAESPYRAPEVCLSLAQATPQSDLYSAGVLLAELFNGTPANEMRDAQTGHFAVPPLSRLPQSLEAEADDLRGILQSMTHADPSKRWSSAQEVLDILTETFTSLLASAAVNEPTPPPSSTPPGIYEEGMLLDEQYRVIRRLGNGATAETYLAFDIMAEKQFVLKKLKEPEHALALARREYHALSTLQHRNIVRVVHLFPPNASFHVLMEYVPGMPLSALRETFPWEQEQALALAQQVLSALEKLENEQILHGDLSLNNLLWDGETVHLIDFGSAVLRDKNKPIPAATLAYCAPEVERGNEPPRTADLYALGVILYELLSGMSPFERDANGVMQKHRLRSHAAIPDPDITVMRREALLRVCLRACAFAPEDRFLRAADFWAALLQAGRMEPQPVHKETEPRRINEWVTAIGGAYRNSRVGNSDNRGLDTDFADKTYVPTRLDTDLIPNVLAGKYAVVFLSGNPGDGKTAFLMKLQEQLQQRGAVNETTDAKNGWRMRLDNHLFVANYDASESSGGKRANDLIAAVLQPLQGDSEPAPQRAYTALLAINDGKLRDRLLHNRDYGWLGRHVSRGLDLSEGKPDPRVLIVDLKKRSIVNAATTPEKALADPDLYEKITLTLVQAAKWRECQTCRARHDCPIKFNRDSLADPEHGAHVRFRLRLLLRWTHLQHDKHITFRDLRSVLAYLITAGLTCERVHETRESRQELPAAAFAKHLYFRAAFNPDDEADDLLRAFARLDPAKTLAPRWERWLHFRTLSGDDSNLAADPIFLSFDERASQPLRATMEFSERQEVWKRRLFFEENETERQTVSPALPSARTLAPYRHDEAFLSALQSENGSPEMSALKLKICAAISRANGVSDERMTRQFLCIRTSGQQAGDLVIFKRFPHKQFALKREFVPHQEMEMLPDALTLNHPVSEAALTINLDLFEILMRFDEGYLPGADAQSSLMTDLAQFETRLLNQRAEELLILEAGRLLHRVWQADGVIHREFVSNTGNAAHDVPVSDLAEEN